MAPVRSSPESVVSSPVQNHLSSITLGNNGFTLQLAQTTANVKHSMVNNVIPDISSPHAESGSVFVRSSSLVDTGVSAAGGSMASDYSVFARNTSEILSKSVENGLKCGGMVLSAAETSSIGSNCSLSSGESDHASVSSEDGNMLQSHPSAHHGPNGTWSSSKLQRPDSDASDSCMSLHDKDFHQGAGSRHASVKSLQNGQREQIAGHHLAQTKHAGRCNHVHRSKNKMGSHEGHEDESFAHGPLHTSAVLPMHLTNGENGDVDVMEVDEAKMEEIAAAARNGEWLCAVCGDNASGNFFGATVCLPCKSFFIRCTKDGEPDIQMQCRGTCDINKLLRNRCQYCRFQRCLAIGMSRKDKPEVVLAGEGQELCRVCGDLANGLHFGVFTCEGCKKFFRRALKEHESYVCRTGGQCQMNPRTRNHCRYCRYKRCVVMGMSREAIKMGRPRKVLSQGGAKDWHHHASSDHDDTVDSHYTHNGGTHDHIDVDRYYPQCSQNEDEHAFTPSSGFNDKSMASWDGHGQYQNSYDMTATTMTTACHTDMTNSAAPAYGHKSLAMFGGSHGERDDRKTHFFTPWSAPNGVFPHSSQNSVFPSSTLQASPIVRVKNGFAADPSVCNGRQEGRVRGENCSTSSQCGQQFVSSNNAPHSASHRVPQSQAFIRSSDSTVFNGIFASPFTSSHCAATSCSETASMDFKRERDPCCKQPSHFKSSQDEGIYVNSMSNGNKPRSSINEAVGLMVSKMPSTCESTRLTSAEGCSTMPNEILQKALRAAVMNIPSQVDSSSTPHSNYGRCEQHWHAQRAGSLQSSASQMRTPVVNTTCSSAVSGSRSFPRHAFVPTSQPFSCSSAAASCSSASAPVSSTAVDLRFKLPPASFTSSISHGMRRNRSAEFTSNHAESRTRSAFFNLGQERNNSCGLDLSPPHKHWLASAARAGDMSDSDDMTVDGTVPIKIPRTDPSFVSTSSHNFHLLDLSHSDKVTEAEKTRKSPSISPSFVFGGSYRRKRSSAIGSDSDDNSHSDHSTSDGDSLKSNPCKSNLGRNGWRVDSEKAAIQQHDTNDDKSKVEKDLLLLANEESAAKSEGQAGSQHESGSKESTAVKFDPFVQQEQMYQNSEYFCSLDKVMEGAEDAHDHPFHKVLSSSPPSEIHLLEDLMQQHYNVSPRDKMTYWSQLAAHVPAQHSFGDKMPPEYRKILDSMLVSFEHILNVLDHSKYEPKFGGNDWPEENGEMKKKIWGWIQLRIVKGIAASMACAYLIPGMDKLHPNDKTLLLSKPYCFAMMILIHAGLFFDLEKGLFKYYFTFELPDKHPMQLFRERVLLYGRRLASLHMDLSEVALLFAINTACLEVGHFEDANTLLEVRQDLLMTYASYLACERKVDPRERLDALFQLMPRLRLLGHWHNSLTKNMMFDSSLMTCMRNMKLQQESEASDASTE